MPLFAAFRADRVAAPPGIMDVFSSRTVLLVMAGLFYAGRLTRGSFDAFGADWFGLTYNSMLDHLLQGRWDVDPAAIGAEAFVRDGKSYTYFGPFPALLRVPFALLLPEWRSLHVERLSCWLAIMVGVSAQIGAMTGALTAVAPPLRRMLTAPLLLACTLSGPPMLLSWKGGILYHEAILWGWAWAAVFVATALPVLGQAGSIGRGRLCALGICAGACLLTRSTTGAGLVALTAVLIGWVAVASFRRGGMRQVIARVGAPVAVLGLLILLTGLVNWGRWGSPFVFADLHLQAVTLEEFPDRLARLDRFGALDWHRFGTGLLYYLAPVWNAGLEQLFPLQDHLVEFYDSIERPASSLLLTDPAWCLLSAFGLVQIFTRRVPLGVVLLVGALSVAPTVILAAWSLTFRYRADFAPLLLALSCIGLRGRFAAARGTGQGRTAVLLGCCLQVGIAAFAGRSYAQQYFGPTPGYEGLSLACLTAQDCPDAPPSRE